MALARTHTFQIRTAWTGNRGSGTSSYSAYSRDHEITAPGKAAAVQGSSDPAFRGDGSRYSPEEMLVGALSSCHMLWFLHLCSDAGITVMSYDDAAHGVMRENADGSGAFVDVVLNPAVSLANDSDRERAADLHEQAHRMCFIARSVNFPVAVRPTWASLSSKA